MSIQVRRVKKLSDDERRLLYGWGTDIFGGDHLQLRYRAMDWHFVVYADGRPVSQQGVCQQAVKVNVRCIDIHRLRPRRVARWVYRLANRNVPSIKVGGIGGWVAPPSAQRQWYAAFAWKHALKFIRDELGLDFMLGFAVDRMRPHYERIHAQVIPDPVYFDQPAGKVRCPTNTMVLSLRGKAWPPGIVDIGGLPW